MKAFTVITKATFESVVYAADEDEAKITHNLQRDNGQVTEKVTKVVVKRNKTEEQALFANAVTAQENAIAEAAKK